MTLDAVLKLAGLTLTAPRDAARALIDMRLGNDALWIAFLLSVVVTGLVHVASVALQPGASLIVSVGVFIAMQAALLAATIWLFTQVGRMLGGAGRLRDMAVLMIWMQILWAVFQGLLLPLVFISDVMVLLGIVAGFVIGLWVLVHFVDVAHGMHSLFKSGGVLLVSVFALATFLSILLSLVGYQPNGMS